MSTAAHAPTCYPRTAWDSDERPHCRVIVSRVAAGASEPAMFEWKLVAESWTDQHPHTEYNFVIEGELHVESGGVTVAARAGDVVCVPAGAVGRYWAPKYARLLAIYGPGDDAPSPIQEHRRLDTD